MPKIRSLAEIQEKWVRVTPGRQADYEAGVKSPKEDWATQAAAAEDRYVEGVTQAAQEGRYGRGIKKAGTEKWQRKAVEVGVARWGPGVRAAASDYAEGFAPYREVIERTTLPPRFPAGDPRNYERVQVLGQALHEKKVRG